MTGSLLAAAVLVLGMLCVMAARVAGPFGQQAAGKLLLEHRLDVRERLLLHRRSIYALGLVLLGGAITGAIPRGLELVGIAGATGIVLGLPAVYRLTDGGIGFNAVVFRPWSELADTQERRGGLLLCGRDGLGDFPVVCLNPATREDIRRIADVRTGQAGHTDQIRRAGKNKNGSDYGRARRQAVSVGSWSR